MTATETAKLLGVSDHTIRHWCKDPFRPLPHTREGKGRAYNIDPEQLRQWLRKNIGHQHNCTKRVIEEFVYGNSSR